ncbi:MAG: hypothetical protein NT075_33485 [Chloroflexi bacterium]|nr:hypothetical protein [Chloroflexota bacterium]
MSTDKIQAQSQPAPEKTTWVANIAKPAGYILAISYPVLALSTGFRAVYQLFFKAGLTNHLPSLLTGVTAICYLLATFGFAYRRRWTWWLSVLVLMAEIVLTLSVGIWSLLDPLTVGETAWRHFGADYGYFPLFQPMLGLLWLFWPPTLVQYGLKQAKSRM